MNQNDDAKIYLVDVIDILWNRKSLIASVIMLSALVSIIYSLNISNSYTSKVLLAPVDAEDNLSSKLGNLSSLASISGVNMQQGNNKTFEAIERIKSYDFFTTYFLPNIKLQNIMAAQDWDPIENRITYDKSIYDSQSDKWILDPSTDLTKPSDQTAFNEYLRMLTITQDNETQFVSLSINHKSPFVAKYWLEVIVYNINESMRGVDKKNAESAINYLNYSLDNAKVQSLKEVISNLLESQMQILMLASSNEAYVFKVLDSPIAPEKRSAPNRALIIIFGTLLGSIIIIFFVIISHYRKKI